MRYLLAILLIAGAMACGGGGGEAADSAKPTESALTIHMRSLEAQAKDWRQQVLGGGPIMVPDRVSDSLFLATPTEGKIKDQQKYNQMAENFQFSALMLRTSQKGEEVLNFNGIVNSCIRCHQAFCPGPIKRIEKLRIQ